jgi:hypothetical protein
MPGPLDAVPAGLTPQELKSLRLFDTAVRLPLVRCKRPGLTVPIIVDGLDQPRPGARELILDALQQLTHTARRQVGSCAGDCRGAQRGRHSRLGFASLGLSASPNAG